jgi:hypothetical protein
MHANFVMKKNIIIYFLLVAWFKHGFSQTPKPIFSLADSSINVYFGANLKTTMLLTNRRPAPSTGTAYLLLPKDATGVEGTFDINARASTPATARILSCGSCLKRKFLLFLNYRNNILRNYKLHNPE